MSRTTAAASIALGVTGAIAAGRLWQRARVRRTNRSIPAGRKIVILGAGFGGLSAARELAGLLPGREHGEIILIDENNYLVFTPMLTEVAGDELDPRHATIAPRRLSKRISFEQGRVHKVDLATRSVVINKGIEGSGTRTINADHMVMALGSVPNYYHIPELRDYAFSIKSLADAAGIRDRVVACLERANWETDAALRRELLTFVVGGGGSSGVETMAAINDLARSLARDYPNLVESDIRSVVVESGERLLAELSPDLASFAQAELEKRGVEVLLRTKIAGAGKNYIELEGGARIMSRTIVWAGGIAPNPIVETLECRRSRHGAIVVDEYCAVPEHPGVWAIADCAEVPRQGSDHSYAPTAQNATREGALVARNIVASLRGAPLEPFRYEPVGELALVGRHSGVAKIYGYHLAGLLPWLMWRAVYVSKMPGVAQPARAVIDWLLDAAFGRNVAEFPTDRAIIDAPLTPGVRTG